MSRHPRRWAALVLVSCVLPASVTVVLLVAGLGQTTPGDASGLGGWGGAAFVVASLAFGSAGALLTARLPENRVGWVICCTAVLLGVNDAAYQYADQALYGSLQGAAGGRAAALVQSVSAAPTLGLLAIAVLLFPDGRVVARHRRAVLLPPVAGIALVTAGFTFRPGRLDAPFGSVDNPLGVPGTFGLTDALTGFGWIFMAVGVAVAAFVTRRRFNDAGGLERQQLKWLAWAAAVSGAAIVGVVLSYFVSADGMHQLRSVTLAVGFAVFPVAIGIAIVRYRLYDIDLVLSRTLTYGVLTATLAGAYLACVLLAQVVLSPFTQGSGLAVAASTLAVAGAARPLRSRIQSVVDRRFFRRRYDSARTLSRFAARAGREVDLDRLVTALTAVVHETMQPAHLSLWMSPTTPPRARAERPG